MNPLQTLQRRFRPGPGNGQRLGPDLGSGLDVFGGCEKRVPADHYRWDGLRRTKDSNARFAIVQYTLDGHGAFDTPDRHYPVSAEDCFFAIVPSAHVYHLPDDSADWTFVWVLIDHPYVVDRLTRVVQNVGPVIHAPAGSDLPEALSGLLAQRDGAAADDRFSREHRLFDLIIAAERAAYAEEHGGDEREQLLSRTRQILESNDMARPNVDDIAAAFGMSRSNFSHHFRATTGLTPAAFVRDLRLSRAREMLIGGDVTLKAIARALGFADVNHFCKAFRARFGFTPGAFRRQVRGRWPAARG